MLKGKAKRSLAFVLAACMLLALLPSFGAGASAASVSYTEVDPSVIDAGAAVLPEAEQDAEQDVPAADEEVHVIILFEQKSLAKKGFSTKDLLENEKAASYSSSLKKQQLSLVDRIERDGRGLNLCNETRIGILNHTTGQPRGTLEADVVRLADRVAYINHDLDDAMRGGIVQPEDVPAIVRERVGERNSVRINSILTDIIAHSGDGELRMSPDMREAVDVFTTFMYEGVYYNPIAKGEERKVQNILGSIWEYYVNHIDELPVVYQSIADDEGPQRAVCDYVSGMTDSYALEVYSELFIPAAWTIK